MKDNEEYREYLSRVEDLNFQIMKINENLKSWLFSLESIEYHKECVKEVFRSEDILIEFKDFNTLSFEDAERLTLKKVLFEVFKQFLSEFEKGLELKCVIEKFVLDVLDYINEKDAETDFLNYEDEELYNRQRLLFLLDNLEKNKNKYIYIESDKHDFYYEMLEVLDFKKYLL